jgi:hypothetical protein
MNIRLALLVGVICAVLASVGVTLSAGLFANIPLFGSPSYCAGTNTGPLGPVCTVTVPAGPPFMTGAEIFPADTGVTAGGAAGSAMATGAQLGSGARVVAFTSTPTTIQMGNHVTFQIMATGGPATVTVNLPAAPFDGERAVISCPVATTLTVATAPGVPTGANGTTILPAVSGFSCAAGASVAFFYCGSVPTCSAAGTGTFWYRIQ